MPKKFVVSRDVVFSEHDFPYHEPNIEVVLPNNLNDENNFLDEYLSSSDQNVEGVTDATTSSDASDQATRDDDLLKSNDQEGTCTTTQPCTETSNTKLLGRGYRKKKSSVLLKDFV